MLFVSTINRSYGQFLGRGDETLAWEIPDIKTMAKGKWIYQGGGLNDHFKVCRQLANSGVIKEDE